jgi:hypothetical protein
MSQYVVLCFINFILVIVLCGGYEVISVGTCRSVSVVQASA